MNAIVRHIDLPAHRRVFAVSDIHGHLDYFKGLLEKLRFSTDDILIILGDLVDKGPRSVDTLRYVMQLCKTHTVHVLQGNCDRILFDPLPNQWLLHYLSSWNGHLLINEFAALLGYVVRRPEDLDGLRTAILEAFPEECAFLSSLPTILENDEYIFVHGGVPRETRLDELDAWSCMKNDNFLGQGHHFRRWCIVGHWPATLYHEHYPCANPLVSREQHIVSIDGGCVIKADGQLNALHIPPKPDGNFTWTAYDSLPTAVAAEAQAPSEDSFNIRFGDNALKLLEQGAEFSTCLHLSSGRRMKILTRDLWITEKGVFCEDSTDYHLSVQPGDVLSIVHETSRGRLAKKDGIVGWYTGALMG